jgi:hypothetical protein
MKPSIATPEETDAREGMRDTPTQHRGRSMTELTSTFTPCEIAGQAVAAIRALNEVTHGGGELTNATDVRLIVAALRQSASGCRSCASNSPASWSPSTRMARSRVWMGRTLAYPSRT